MSIDGGIYAGYQPDLSVSEPIEVPLTTGVWTKAFDANHRRHFLDIQNPDAANPIRFLFANKPFALDFDGTDHVNIDTILTAGSKILDSERGSIDIRIRNSSVLTQRNTLFSVADTATNEYLRLYIDNADGKLKAELRNAAGVQWALETDLALSAIYPNQAVLFLDIKLLQRFLDGQDITSAEPVLFVNENAPAQSFTVSTNKSRWFGFLTNADNARLGSLNTNGAGEVDQFEGDMGRVRVMDFRGVGIKQAHEIIRYGVDEGTGLTLTDRSTNGYNGTISGAAWIVRSGGLILSANRGRSRVDNECPRTEVWLKSEAAAPVAALVAEG
jgi:hypothetical protein